MKQVRVGAINGLRVLAMLWVFAFHTWEFGGSPSAIWAGPGFTVDFVSVFTRRLGIPLFMGICGFCLFLSYAGRAEEAERFLAGGFYRRRVLRITPGYYGAMLFVVLQPFVLVTLFKLLGKEASWPTVPGA